MDVEQSILEAVRSLPPHKQLEVLDHARELQQSPQKNPLESVKGLWADLNISLSEEDIDEVRREMWKNFPRDDI